MQTRDQVSRLLSAHYSKRFSGKVWATYDEQKRAYLIRGDNLPARPDLVKLYPNGWSLLDYIKPTKARELIKGVDHEK